MLAQEALPPRPAVERTERRARVCGVDDDTLIRDGLTALLRDHEVVSMFTDVGSFLAARPRCDVVLLDLHLSDSPHPRGRQGAQAIRDVREAGYTVLIYTNERRLPVLLGCLRAGASGISHKTEPLSDLSRAIARVAAGETVITTTLTGLAEMAQRRGELPSLSPRQVEVLSARARGEAYRAIASRLFLSQKTVEEYMAEVSKKFTDFLATHSPADLERALGVGPGDLLDWRLDEPRVSR